MYSKNRARECHHDFQTNPLHERSLGILEWYQYLGPDDSRSPENATMKACVLCDVGRIEVRDVVKPKLSPRDVLVRIAAVGICGTDTHIFAGHANYNTDGAGKQIPLTVEPQILGHEISGQIEEVGSEVHDLKPGDRVVLDQGLNCVSAHRQELCEYCATGDSH